MDFSPLAADVLPPWNDGGAKRAIVDFVMKVTKEGGPDFVPAAERIATFDNDGTLWAEQALYFQFIFALDRVKVLAPQHPEWKDKEPFASLLKGDMKGALAGGEPVILQIVMATHTGITTEEFERIVSDWIATARHPKTNRLYTEMAYQPMLELLAYLAFVCMSISMSIIRTPSVNGRTTAPPSTTWTRASLKPRLRDGRSWI